MWRHIVSENESVDKDVDRSLKKMPASANGHIVDPENTGCHGHHGFSLGPTIPFLQPGMAPLLCGHGGEGRTRSSGSGPSLTEAGSSCGIDSMSSPGTFSPVVNPAMVTSSHSLPPLDTPGFACAPDEMPRTTNYQTQAGVNAVHHPGYSTGGSHLPGCPHAHGMYVHLWNQSPKGFYEGHPPPGPMFAGSQTLHHSGNYGSSFQPGPTTSGPAGFVPSTDVLSGTMDSSDFATQTPMEYGISTPISSSRCVITVVHALCCCRYRPFLEGLKLSRHDSRSSSNRSSIHNSVTNSTQSNIHEECLDTSNQPQNHAQGVPYESKDIFTPSSPSSEKYDPACFPEPELSQGRKSEIYNTKPQGDGLYHCYFEETEKCGHEPVKLKCNYEYVILVFAPWVCLTRKQQVHRFAP